MPLLTDHILPPGTLSHREQPTIEGSKGVILRPWHDDDAPMVTKAFACPDIQRWHVRRMDTDAESLAWIAGWHRSWAAEAGASWAIVDNGEPAGQVGLRSVLLFEGTASISYWIQPGARGNGIAGRAVEALTQWAFAEAGFHRLALHHSIFNQPSCRVASKAGYELEGVLRSATPHADGWHDMHAHARLSVG